MSLLSLEPPVYQVGDILYSPTSGAIEKQGEINRLRAREANLFLALIDSFPEVLSRKEIEERLWKDSYATNATINQTIKALRFSLCDEQRTLIRTIPKQGYVLATKPIVAQWEEPSTESTPNNNETSPLKDVGAQSKVDNSSFKQEASLRLSSLFSINQWAAVLAFAIAVFALASSGLFSDAPERISHKYKGHWILFTPSKGELESLHLEQYSTPQFVLKTNNGYRMCTNVERGLKCYIAD